MTDKVIETLPDILKNHICTLKRASKDDKNNEYLCDSLIRVINFDKIPREYVKQKHLSNMPSSNDALYISSENKYCFIEFKNGNVSEKQVYQKIYDSLIMAVEMGVISDYDFMRENGCYILVYNSEKTNKIPASPEREKTFSYILALAEQEERLFGIERFERYLFRETHTYTKEQFEKNFIIPTERAEQ